LPSTESCTPSDVAYAHSQKFLAANRGHAALVSRL